MSNTILITGATGNIGSKLATQILARKSSDRVVLLVRGRSDAEACRRLFTIFDAMPDTAGLRLKPERLEILAGDITRKWLGLDRSTYDRLSRSVTHLVHSAASTCFTLPLDAARDVNYTGTVNMMQLARACLKHGRLVGVAYVSTAYVNGPRAEPIYEGDLEERPTFFNTYDRTKWEAERYVRSLTGELPLCIFRPSIVVGDSHTGHTSSFNVLYAPLRLISRDLVRLLPGREQTVLDVVPSDYVSCAMDHILLHRPFVSGQTYHLVAGMDASMTVAEIVAQATRTFSMRRHRRPIRFVSPDHMERAALSAGGNNPRVNEVLRVFAPFMTSNRVFDSTHTRKALADSGISCPSFDQYIQTCLEFCQQTQWGKHEIRKSARDCRLKDRGHRQPRLPLRLAWDLAPSS